MACSFHFGGDSFRSQKGMGSVGLVYPQQKQDVSPTDAESSPRSKVPTFGVLPWRWADVMSDRGRHWKATTQKIFELLPKILNQKVSKKQIPPRIKSNKPVHLHVLPPKNKTHHSNPPNPFNPQSTQAAEDGGPGRPVASGFAEGQRLAVLEQLGELSLKPLWRCRDIMEDCVFDVFTVDVLYKWFFLFIKDNEAACLTLFSLELI